VKEKILVALDVASRESALGLADQLRGAVGGFKIGSRLFTAEGPSMVRALTERGDRIFLDLKFHDIPNTVAGACRAAAQLGVSIINVHASGGAAMLKAAGEAARGVNPHTKVIAVTVLTSLNEGDLKAMGVAGTPGEQVLRLAQLTKSSGLDGVVCSAHEIAALRGSLGKDFMLVVPGIRPAGADLNDQSRVMTPAEAHKAGADILVIGRPITAAPDPASAAQDIAQSLGF
jgi:orotidine-5'-phosphate decarboxylase